MMLSSSWWRPSLSERFQSRRARTRGQLRAAPGRSERVLRTGHEKSFSHEAPVEVRATRETASVPAARRELIAAMDRGPRRRRRRTDRSRAHRRRGRAPNPIRASQSHRRRRAPDPNTNRLGTRRQHAPRSGLALKDVQVGQDGEHAPPVVPQRSGTRFRPPGERLGDGLESLRLISARQEEPT